MVPPTFSQVRKVHPKNKFGKGLSIEQQNSRESPKEPKHQPEHILNIFIKRKSPFLSLVKQS
jgi:hypothetical protein